MNKGSLSERIAALSPEQAKLATQAFERALDELDAEGERAKQTELRKEYTAKMAEARGNAEACRRIKEHYRSLGLDVDHIGFTIERGR